MVDSISSRGAGSLAEAALTARRADNSLRSRRHNTARADISVREPASTALKDQNSRNDPAIAPRRYYSPVVRIDPGSQSAVLLFRDGHSGEVQRSFKIQGRVEAYHAHSPEGTPPDAAPKAPAAIAQAQADPPPSAQDSSQDKTENTPVQDSDSVLV